MPNPRKLLNRIGALVNEKMPFIAWSISLSALFFESSSRCRVCGSAKCKA